MQVPTPENIGEKARMESEEELTEKNDCDIRRFIYWMVMCLGILFCDGATAGSTEHVGLQRDWRRHASMLCARLVGSTL